MRPSDARFEQHLRGFDVVDRVGLKVAAPALAHAGLRREVEDVGDAVEELAEVGVLDARFHQPEVRERLQLRDVLVLERTRIVVRKTVEPHHVGAALGERATEGGADEPGRAGDECLHASAVRTLSGRRHGRPRGFSAAWTVRPVAVVTWSARRTTSY